MSLKYQILRSLPPTWHFWLLKQSERRKLAAIGQIGCDTSALIKGMTYERIMDALTSPVWNQEWEAICSEINALGGAKGPSAVNMAEQRTLYILMRALNAHSVLEVGTNVGGSTVNLVAALRENAKSAGEVQMVTLDVVDQNAPDSIAKKLGQLTPREMIEKMGAGAWVRFLVEPSLSYLTRKEMKFDFIFLDGDHLAPTVYQELPAALRILNPGGVILLHDYFPDGKPIYSDQKIIAGPWLAAQRFQREKAGFHVIPLGTLPWETKQGSKVTVLAMVVGN
jgi:predicted O-methyltransferase YrrM